mmetsp:Transcript_24572/g.72784  ORF Transcript_24572/g.72784 Transcript_24572/m.72784 type:complete len:217 (+) Transcript_24572:415-1065(+)
MRNVPAAAAACRHSRRGWRSTAGVAGHWQATHKRLSKVTSAVFCCTRMQWPERNVRAHQAGLHQRRARCAGRCFAQHPAPNTTTSGLQLDGICVRRGRPVRQGAAVHAASFLCPQELQLLRVQHVFKRRAVRRRQRADVAAAVWQAAHESLPEVAELVPSCTIMVRPECNIRAYQVHVRRVLHAGGRAAKHPAPRALAASLGAHRRRVLGNRPVRQ